MAHGKSLELREITLPDPAWVHEHTTRPHRPYVNPARDLRPGRRLRGPTSGRKNKPPQGKPQKPKRPKGGSK